MNLLLWVVAVLFVLPAGWLVVTSVRIGATQRARRAEILGLLGARSSDARAMLWGEARTGLLLGSTVSVVVALASMVVDLPLPAARFTLRASDIRGGAGLVIVALVIAGLATAAVAVSRVGLTAERRRAAPRVRTATYLRAVLAVVIACLYVIGMNLAIANALVDLIPVVFGLGMLATLIALPTSVRSWIVLFARRWRARAWAEGNPGGVVGAGQLAAAPGPPTRFGATAAIVIVLVTYVVSFAQAMGVSNSDSRLAMAAAGDGVAVVLAHQQLDGEAWRSALTEVSRDFAVVQQRTTDDFTTELVGSQEDLASAGILADGSRPWWARADYALASAEVHVGAIEPPSGRTASTLLAVRRDGGAIDLDALRDQIARVAAPAWTVQRPGEDWTAGSALNAYQARWVSWFGAIGIVLGLAALWTSYSNELLRATRSLLAVQVLAPDGRFVAEVLLWRIVAPVAVAVVGGSGLAMLLIWPLTNADYQLPIGFTVTCALAAAATGMVAWYTTWRASLRAANRMSLGITEE